MKPKKFVQIYGKVVLPIIRGMTVRYFSNGTWKETARVRRVIEVTDAYIKFNLKQTGFVTVLILGW